MDQFASFWCFKLQKFWVEYYFKICFKTHNVELKLIAEDSPVWKNEKLMWFSFLAHITRRVGPFKSLWTKDQKSRLWRLPGFGCQSHSAGSSSKAQWGFVTDTSLVWCDLMQWVKCSAAWITSASMFPQRCQGGVFSISSVSTTGSSRAFKDQTDLTKHYTFYP